MRLRHRLLSLSLLATAICTVSAQAQEAVRDGLWSDSSTWSGGDVPQAGDIVHVEITDSSPFSLEAGLLQVRSKVKKEKVPVV